MRYYTGIGSRRAPASVEAKIREVAELLNAHGYCLRSGHAEGPDSWFERYASHAEIFLPWGSFGEPFDREHMLVMQEPLPDAYKIAAAVHPTWDRLKPGAKKLHARNAHQVLGPKLNDPSDFVVCWTPGAKVVGGTATAIRIANVYRVTVFNLADDLVDLFRRTLVINEISAWIDARPKIP